MTKSRLLKYALLGIAAALIAHYLIKKEEKPKGHPRDYAEIAAEVNPHLLPYADYAHVHLFVGRAVCEEVLCDEKRRGGSRRKSRPLYKASPVHFRVFHKHNIENYHLPQNAATQSAARQRRHERQKIFQICADSQAILIK